MARMLVCLLVLVAACVFAAPAYADIMSVNISPEISIVGATREDTDYDSSVSDGLSSITTTVLIWMYIDHSPKVRTVLRLDAKGLTDSADKPLTLDRAYIEVKDFIAAGTTIAVGKVSLIWTVRTRIGAGALQGIYTGAMERAFIFRNKPVAFQVKYAFSATTAICAGWGKYAEGSIPGDNANDTDVTYVKLDKKWNKTDSGFIGFIYYKDTKRMLKGDIWFVDLGLNLALSEPLEVYLEAAHQNGIAHTAPDGFGALAANGGFEYTFTSVSVRPYFGGGLTYFTGNSGTRLGFQRVRTNFNETLICENDYFNPNLAWSRTDPASTRYRSGFLGLKVYAGIKQLTEKIGLDFIAGFYTADGDVPGGKGRGLGVEIDLMAAYSYSADLSFGAGLGVFKPSSDLAGAATDPLWLFILGVNNRF
ncbi:MAG: hypothetical protein WC712_09295 [Candidatus Brocadiia bacterium]